MRPWIELAAESRAEELCNHAHVLFRQPKHLCQHATQIHDSLRRVIQRQYLAVPDCGGGMQLERIVCLCGCDVGFIELDWRAGKCGFGISPVALQSGHW